VEHDQRVFSHLSLLKSVDNPADLIVHGGDHRRIGAPGRNGFCGKLSSKLAARHQRDARRARGLRDGDLRRR
jgi:hypothetical protein